MHFIFGLKLLTHSFQVLFFQRGSASGASLCIGGAERGWPRGGSTGHDDFGKAATALRDGLLVGERGA